MYPFYVNIYVHTPSWYPTKQTISSIVLIYFVHICAALRVAFIALFRTKYRNYNNPTSYYQNDMHIIHQREIIKEYSFFSRLYSVIGSLVLGLPIFFTVFRSIPIIASSLIITQVFVYASVRMTRASMISIGLAQGILDTYSAVGKEINDLSGQM